ncbi:MAG: FecR domain-containing protein, partial [Candidatus Acidoferrales bacterium]
MRRGRKTRPRPAPGTQRRSTLAALCLCALAALAVVTSLTAQNPAPAAGKISALIPTNFILRGQDTFEATKGAAVFWKDIIRTERGGRVRVALTDGSILNIGSQTELRIIRQDAASEQTELELIYGRVRADVVKRTRPGGKFNIRTQQAVAGVIGTGKFLNATPTATTVLVLNGLVIVSSADPNIPGSVTLQAGQLTIIRTGEPPDPPRDATPGEVDVALRGTSSTPQVTIDPDTLLAGTVADAVISGTDLTGASAVNFVHPGITTALGQNTGDTLTVTLTVLADVPPGTYPFSVLLPDDNLAEGNLVVELESPGGVPPHDPPTPVITGEWYYDPVQPPEPITGDQLSVGQGSVVLLSGADSTAASGHAVTRYEWTIADTQLSGEGPTFVIDTWRLEPGTSYTVSLLVYDDDNHSALAELQLFVRELPNPDDVIPNCLVAGYEALNVNLFISCFSAEQFRGYSVLEESIRNFLQGASEVRVYYRIDNKQEQPNRVTYQLTFELTFTSQDNPTAVQLQTESITLRMQLFRYRDFEEWLIIDFSSRVARTGASSEGLVSPEFGLALDPDTLSLTAGGDSTQTTVTVQAFSGFSDTVQLSLSGLPTGVTASFASTNVAGGSSTTLTLSASPTAALGTFTGDSAPEIVGRSGTLEHSQALTLQIQAGGAPAISVSPSEINFEDVLVGTASEAQLVTITNTGTAALTVSNIALSGSSDFALSAAPALPAVLAPGATA